MNWYLTNGHDGSIKCSKRLFRNLKLAISMENVMGTFNFKSILNKRDFDEFC